MDTNPDIIRLHADVGELIMRMDQLDTRIWNSLRRGLYIAPELPSMDADRIAGNVVLTLAYIAVEGL